MSKLARDRYGYSRVHLEWRLFLRQQLGAINTELPRLESANTDLHASGNITEDGDDLDVLVRRVDALPVGAEVRRVAPTKARRLRRIPHQDAEHGVVRNYLALPWTLPPPGSDTLKRSDLPQTQSRTTFALIRSSDGQQSTSLLSSCVH